MAKKKHVKIKSNEQRKAIFATYADKRKAAKKSRTKKRR